MQSQRRRDTAAEVAVRKALHRMGFRYRVDRPVVPGLRRRADLVFGPAKVAVFVDGCFWHSCPQHATFPAANADWWRDKLAGNVARDRATDRALASAGWLAVRVWEHEDPEDAARRIADAVQDRRPGKRPGKHRPTGGVGRPMRAIWNGHVIADSDRTVVVEGNHYFPLDSVDPAVLRPSSTTSVCPWKGTASYYSLEVDGQVNPDAAWFYPTPKPAAEQITGHVAFWRGVTVTT